MMVLPRIFCIASRPHATQSLDMIQSRNRGAYGRWLAICALFGLASGTAWAEENAQFWLQEGAASLQQSLSMRPNLRQARNIILFVGDGMGVSTVTGARIFAGQRRGQSGERYQLSFERFPYLALSKTYSANQQTPDSAPTMTAIMTGVKTNDGLLSLDQAVARNEAHPHVLAAHRVTTLLEQAEQAGKATGIVSTARVTHATPAATYAHIANRDWESNALLSPEAARQGVPDIAAQLIALYGPPASTHGIEVVFGGGRSHFLPTQVIDADGSRGKRTDGRDLIQEYQQRSGGQVVQDLAAFQALDPANTRQVLGLFSPSHMAYAHDRPQDPAGEPSLAEMTSKAIAILQQQRQGYFLMVEAGRIDHASHAGNAFRTFSETEALSDAVDTALKQVNLEETLIIVTADHSHTLTIGGYPKRGNPILGKVIEAGQQAPALGADGKPYTTVTFANGPGHSARAGNASPQAGRQSDLSTVDTEDPDFHQESLVPLDAETHGGEDVAIYAIGPQAHLIHGVQEQSYIYQVMKAAFGF